MKKIKIIAIMAFIATSTVFVSCKKEIMNLSKDNADPSIKQVRALITIPNCNVSVINGRLYFPTSKDVNAYYSFLENNTTDVINDFEIQNGFISYSRKVENIMKDYEILNENENTTLTEIHNFWNQYSNYINFTEDDFDNKIKGLHNRLMNSEGYLQIDNLALKFVDNLIYSTNINNIDQLVNNNYNSELIAMAEVSKKEFKKLG